MSSEQLVVKQRFHYDARPSAVFKALTRPKRLVKWFLKGAKIRPEEGGDYTFTWRGGTTHTGRIEKVVPDRVLVLTWPDSIKGKLYETRVAFTLTKKGKGTILEVEHTGFKEGPTGSGFTGQFNQGGHTI